MNETMKPTGVEPVDEEHFEQLSQRVESDDFELSADVVAGITSQNVPEPSPSPEPPSVLQGRDAAPLTEPPAPRRRPGRPRGRRRMEPFSSKIEISLRDEVDAYTARYGESYVDLLDRALRAAITAPPPER